MITECSSTQEADSAFACWLGTEVESSGGFTLDNDDNISQFRENGRSHGWAMAAVMGAALTNPVGIPALAGPARLYDRDQSGDQAALYIFDRMAYIDEGAGASGDGSTPKERTLLVEGITESEQVAYLVKHLLDNKSALAGILGISRTALYAWMAGKPVEPTNAAHLARVAACVRRVAEKSTLRRCYDRYVTRPILAKTPALAEVLTDKDFDEQQAMVLLREAWKLSERREAKDQRLDERLAQGGFEPLTQDDKQAHADYNQLMRDLNRGDRG